MNSNPAFGLHWGLRTQVPSQSLFLIVHSTANECRFSFLVWHIYRCSGIVRLYLSRDSAHSKAAQKQRDGTLYPVSQPGIIKTLQFQQNGKGCEGSRMCKF